MRPLVIYHANCKDGWCAAWILHRCLGGAELVSAQHGEDPPSVDNRTTIVVDFSYPRDVMLDMKRYAHSLVVLDHHKSAEADCKDLDFCVFDMQESGATMALKWAEQRGLLLAVEPKEIRAGMGVLAAFVKDRDLWQWKLENSHLINTAIASYPFDLETWDHLARRAQVSPFSLCEEGKAIRRYRDSLIEQHVKHAREIQIGEHVVMGVECTTSDIISDVAGQLAEQQPFGCTWFHTSDGKVVFSLRSDSDGLDVSEVARLYGGGGHRQSAGFKLGGRHLLGASPYFGSAAYENTLGESVG